MIPEQKLLARFERLAMCTDVAIAVEQVVIPRAGQGVFQCPKLGPMRSPVAGGGVPFRDADLDRPVRRQLPAHRQHGVQFVLRGREVAAIVLVRADVVDQVASLPQHAGCRVARENRGRRIGPAASPCRRPASCCSYSAPVRSLPTCQNLTW